MKKYFLSLVLILSSYFSYAILEFGRKPGTVGCLSYDAQYNRLKMKVTYETTSDWVQYVNTFNTYLYIKPVGSSIFIGPFPSTSCASFTCEYDISPLIGTIALPGCYDFFVASDRDYPGGTPPTNGDPTNPLIWGSSSPTQWNLGLTVLAGGLRGFWNACDCPGDSDPLSYVPCDALFDFTMTYSTTPHIPHHYGNILQHTFIPDASYNYAYGNGTLTRSPITEDYMPGSYEVCMNATRITGEECQSCMDICVSDALTTYDNTGDTGQCNLNFDFIAHYTANPSPFLPPTYSGQFIMSSFNPSSTYIFDYGDGTIATGPILPHTYTTPGTFQVCITETKTPPTTICKTCLEMCIGDSYFFRSSTARTADNDANIESLAGNQISIFPNPASSKTELKFKLSKQDNVSVQMIDMTGKKVADIFNGTMNEGSQTLTINTENLASGLYQVKMMIGNKVTTQKLSVVK